jgi:hypothetical protein
MDEDGDVKEWRSRSASLVAVGATGRRKQRRKEGVGEAASEARVNLCMICTPRARVELEEEQGTVLLQNADENEQDQHVYGLKRQASA